VADAGGHGSEARCAERLPRLARAAPTRPRRLLALAVATATLGCGARGPATPPSFVLFVIDTLRADAVSAYGAVASSTPALDHLASGGLLYTRAYAHAPWTLPSHGSLFTGLLPGRHGLGWRRTHAPERLVMLAERLREAGWQTFGYSENVWVSRAFNMAQGFEDFRFRRMGGKTLAALDEAVSAWLEARDPQRPLFLFVNVIDPHWPYTPAPDAAFLPASTSPEKARRLSTYLTACGSLDEIDLAVLRGLYLGNVRDADAKLARTLERFQEAGLADETVWVVTSDHGEQLGEHGLFQHQFSVHEPLLHVPLVVHGVPGAEPGVVDQPVQHVDLVPSLLGWAGLPPAPGLPGRPLPNGPDASTPPRTIFAEYRDPAEGAAPESPLAAAMRREVQTLRADCPPGAPVFGDMRAALRYPLKLVWYAKHPTRLWDLARDPDESLDLASQRPRAARELLTALRAEASSPVAGDPGRAAPLPNDVRRELEALGYVGEE
jgi:arylsulfatase A-like enzyme